MKLLTILGVISLLFTVWFTWRACSGPEKPGGQSRRASIIEAWANIVVGFSFNYGFNFLLLPMVGATLTASSNFWLGWVFTSISILRQYAIRRFFNERIHLFAVRVAQHLK